MNLSKFSEVLYVSNTFAKIIVCDKGLMTTRCNPQ